MWFVFALLSGILWVSEGAWLKSFAGKFPGKTVTWAMITFELFYTLPLLFFTGIPEVKPEFFIGWGISLLLNFVACTLYIKSLMYLPISLSFPLLSLTPLFMTLTGYAMIGEAAGVMQFAGIVLILAGTYILGISGSLKISDLFAPLKALVANKGSRYMILTAFIWSISAVADKIAVVNSSPQFYLATFQTAFSIIYFPIAFRYVDNPLRLIKKGAPVFLVSGVLGVASMLCQYLAMLESHASYVIAVKRGGLLFSIVIGLIFFKEKVSGWRIAAAVIIAAGLVLLS